MTGTLAGTGSFRCATCDYVLSLSPADRVPPCPSCGGTEFVRASLFTAQQPTKAVMELSVEEPADWIDDVRAELEDAGQYLVYDGGDGEPVVHPLAREWTRVGRSLAADIRFDDPTVSRRHVLIVRQADGVRVLDDRSLNGVFVNGERVEWRALEDGDELVVGRHRLHFVDLPAVPDDASALGERVPEPLAG